MKMSVMSLAPFIHVIARAGYSCFKMYISARVEKQEGNNTVSLSAKCYQVAVRRVRGRVEIGVGRREATKGRK